MVKPTIAPTIYKKVSLFCAKSSKALGGVMKLSTICWLIIGVIMYMDWHITVRVIAKIYLPR